MGTDLESPEAKVNADGCNVVVSEAIIRKPNQEAGFANICVSNDDHLEEMHSFVRTLTRLCSFLCSI